MLRGVAGLLVAPLFGFPLFFAALVLVDTALGEGLFLYHLRYEQRALAVATIGDFVHALPASYAAAALVALLAWFARRARGAVAVRPVAVGAGAALGLTLGTLLAGSPVHAESLALAVAGAAFAWLVSLPLGWLADARDEAAL